MLEQWQTERIVDTVERLVYVNVHDTIRETVHDTIRETVTVQLNAQGDTTRKDTERERVSDRTSEHVATIGSTTSTQSSHSQETEMATHQCDVTHIRHTFITKPLLLGLAIGSVMTLLVFLFAKLRRHKR